jgi:DNA-binding NarL/FixJ family response regulator
MAQAHLKTRIEANMISVLVADDHTSIREALGALLEIEDDIQIVAMVSNGQDAVEQAVLHCPDITVMDVSCQDL